MNDESLSPSQDHHSRPWVALVSAVIGAAAFIIAAVIGVDAKHDREAAASEIAAKEAQINNLQQQIKDLKNAGPASGGDSRDLLNQITSLRSELAAKDAEIQKLQNEIQSQPPQPTDPNSSSSRVEPKPTKPVVQEEAGVRFELQGCRQSGSEVTCDLLITNSQSDRLVSLYAARSGSRIVDAQGNESPIKLASLGSNSSRRFAAATLAQGVAVRGSVTFGGGSPVSPLKLLEIVFRIGHSEEHRIQFHDVRLG